MGPQLFLCSGLLFSASVYFSASSSSPVQTNVLPVLSWTSQMGSPMALVVSVLVNGGLQLLVMVPLLCCGWRWWWGKWLSPTSGFIRLVGRTAPPLGCLHVRWRLA